MLVPPVDCGRVGGPGTMDRIGGGDARVDSVVATADEDSVGTQEMAGVGHSGVREVDCESIQSSDVE